MTTFVHIGTEKTGTTTIQEFLHQNSRLLGARGYHFPRTPGLRNHLKLAAYAQDSARRNDLNQFFKLNDKTAIDAFRTRLKADLTKEVQSKNAPHVIFSNEHCSSRLTRPREIEALRDLLLSFSSDIRIIVYLRRQDDFLLSRYSTNIKAGGTEDIRIPNANTIENLYDYAAILDKWAAVFGKDNIIVRPFETSQMAGRNLIADFSNVLGLTIDDGFKIPEDKNRSLDVYTLEFLKLFNRHIPPFVNGRTNKERGDIIELLEAVSHGPRLAVDAHTLSDFMALFTESNAEVARRYLNRADGRLFIEDRPRGAENNNGSLDVEKVVAICAHLWRQKQKQVGVLQKLNAALKNVQDKL